MNISDRYSFDEGAHLHTLDGKPLTGTSSVMSVIAKPLTYWASGLAVAKLGWTNPKFTPEKERKDTAELIQEVIKNISVDDYLTLLDSAYHAHAKSLKKSAGKGKDLHSTLEEYVKLCIANDEGVPQDSAVEEIVQFAKWAIKNVDKFLWSELHTFSAKLWLGGITDCGALLKDGRTVIIDFKSSKDAYISQAIQIAGYSVQIKENGAFTRAGEQVIKPMNIDTFMVIPFGATEFKVEEFKDTPALERGFVSALDLYRLTKSNE